ncbi:hypothetical protein AAFN60_00535 [Roseibacillus persicicus]|uniref:hypothetical protein n=1 Tax=Roseibacillus persicicus TaxID=454148 RepID=UPI00398ABCFB
MFDQFLDLYFSYIHSAVYALAQVIGIYASILLLRKTRNAGPLLLLACCIGKMGISLLYVAISYFEKNYYVDYEDVQLIWLGLSAIDLVTTIFLLVGVVLIAKDFRALIDQQKFSQDLPKVP